MALRTGKTAVARTKIGVMREQNAQAASTVRAMLATNPERGWVCLGTRDGGAGGRTRVKLTVGTPSSKEARPRVAFLEGHTGNMVKGKVSPRSG